MKLLDLYLYANIYILFFWVFYKILINRSKLFHRNRVFIISAFTFSLLLPVLQHNLSTYLESNKVFTSALNPINFIYSTGRIANLNSGTDSLSATIDFNQIISLIIITGCLITLGYFLKNHIRIKALIQRSQLIDENRNRILLCEEDIVPFLYNDAIIISNSTPISERELIIKHESQHYRFGHHYDNYLIQLFQMIFWMNPFFYLLKNHLKDVHEYQVDECLISSGIDATQYKLTLVRFRAGYQKFAIANGLSTNLKNRLKMMNSDQNPKGKWKVFLSIPALSFLFLTLSFSNITPPEEPVMQTVPIVSQGIDSVEIEIITLPEKFRIKTQNEAVMILMNKASFVAIEGMHTPKDQWVKKIIKKYNEHSEERFLKNLSPDVKIVMLKDMDANDKDYKALLDEVSTAIYTMHETHSNEIFGKPFKELNKDQQAKILKMVPPKIYQSTPIQIKPPPTKK